MLDPLPQHPYEPGTRVHDAADTSVAAFTIGSAEIIDARRHKDGTFTYLVRTDENEEQQWPSPFTIAAGTWSGTEPPEADPLFGPRTPAAEAAATPSNGSVAREPVPAHDPEPAPVPAPPEEVEYALHAGAFQTGGARLPASA